jgi:K+-sensing histidine kinase KdpD
MTTRRREMARDQEFPQVPPAGTWFAPAERASRAEIRSMVDYCLRNPITRIILDSVEGYVLVLNEQRQILAANPEALRALHIDDPQAIVGMRPGEAFHCAHSQEAPGGCGTSRNCMTCGAAIAIMASQTTDEPCSGECLMTVTRDNRLEAHEFSVRATPLRLDDHCLTTFVLHDINAEKRRDVLEMVFLHDLSNVITGLQGWSEMLLRRPQEASLIAQNIVNLSERINREIQTQRMILQAEQGELNLPLEPTTNAEILEGVRSFFTGYPPDMVYRLHVTATERVASLLTSPPLLTRILANMVKNALEATSLGEHVRLWYELRDQKPCFVVQNPGRIPEKVALQIFKRSFSTKEGPGRGMGTYSMKLFGEQILGGEVGFTTDDVLGTCFFIKLPGDSIRLAVSSPPRPVFHSGGS